MNYSIIIPHHNVPKLLKRALDSIPKRNDVEIIVVDDASAPEYKEQLRNVCSMRKDVLLIEQNKNKGGGAARNIGLEHATGKFVLFLDADDFYNYCINEILDEYIDTDYDIVFFKGNCVDSETYMAGNRLEYNNEKIDRYLSDTSRNEQELRYQFQVPVCKIIRRKTIVGNDIKFDEINIRNDVTFSYLVGYYAKKIAVDQRAIYCATTREGSVSSFRGADRILTTIDVLGRAVLFFRHKDIDSGSYEMILSHNLYILLRRKDYENFNLGFEHLQQIGLERKATERLFSKRMAKTALSSSVWCIAHAPNRHIRLWSFLYLPQSLKIKNR